MLNIFFVPLSPFSVQYQGSTDRYSRNKALGNIARGFLATAIRSLSPGQRNTSTILHPHSFPLMNWSPVLNRMIMSGLYLIIHKWYQNQVWTDISSLCHVKLYWVDYTELNLWSLVQGLRWTNQASLRPLWTCQSDVIIPQVLNNSWFRNTFVHL